MLQTVDTYSLKGRVTSSVFSLFIFKWNINYKHKSYIFPLHSFTLKISNLSTMILRHFFASFSKTEKFVKL